MKHLHFVFLIFVFSILPTHAQTSSKKLPKDCNALLARQLVEQQADQSKSVAETDKRVNILLRVADFLWIADEETARKYFAEAFQISRERFREKGVETSKSKEGLLMQQPDYRFAVISAIAKRDAELANRLSESVLKEYDEDAEKDRRNANDRETEVEELISLAAQTAKDSPKLSLTLARRAMLYKLLRRWTYSLYQTASNNQPLADQIYGELLNKNADAEVYRLLYLSAYPFGSGRILGVEKYSMGMSVPAAFSPNRNLQRQFITILLRRVMRLTPESTTVSLQNVPETAVAVMGLSDLEPIIAQQFPDLAQTFSQAKIHADSIVEGSALASAKDGNEANKKFNKSFDENLAEVEKANGVGKLGDGQIFQLVNSAKTDENYKKAESWLDKISDEITRTGTTNFFYFNRSKLATEEKRLEDARKYALKVPKIEHRAVLFFDIAEAKLKEPLTKSESLDTLLEVLQTAQKSPDTVEKAQVLLGTAFMYEKVDHFAALGVLAEAIKTANKLDNPNLFAGYVLQVVKGKLFSHYSSYEVPGFDINRTFYELSKNDFQNSLTYATDFSDGYLRTLAVLAVVKDCEKNAKPIKSKSVK